MKKIVTHINPDLDAVVGVWLIKRFLPGWEEAEITFCQSGETLGQKPVDQDPNILHVDTGLGKLDHHQLEEITSAAERCFDFIKKERKGEPFKKLDEKALIQIIKVVTEVDNARDLNWSETESQRYNFYLHSVIAGIRGMAGSDEEAMGFGLKGMDAVFHQVKKSLDAQEELKQGTEFQTLWGKGIGLITGNDSVLWEGEKAGYCLVIRKDQESGGARIYGRYDTEVDLTKAYNQFKKIDPQADWYLHQSKKLLLNAATSHEMKPTKLNLGEIIEVFKK